ncbi:hypothetical protein [Streptomyces lancefieldiae]|uniref:ParB/Sulfiredoxin domain-containing protein n=1 Tax=Streptomyces lancefieldiae TaxID=3075520 RepID=A0ABU3AIY8_9ACTN|nr:hypothetical protein [Streptomyces sp. DSM 40712]MDT0608851.1 hypothetical protein [Streptomyces sp. DSM 40712]
MAIWTGTMPTAKLNDRQIRPSEYHKWEHARRQFARGRDRATVDAYKAELVANGGRLKTPIRLSIDDRTHEVAIGDGHHRCIALMELGIADFAFTWGWRRTFTNTTDHRPFPTGVL